MIRRLHIGCEATVAARSAELHKRFADKAHEKQKTADMQKPCTQMAARIGWPVYHPAMGVLSDADVEFYLLSREPNGHTVVHENSCVDRATGQCDCPRRMTHSSMSNVLSRLKTAFERAGLAGQYQARSGLGNPADSPRLTSLMAALGEEQAS